MSGAHLLTAIAPDTFGIIINRRLIFAVFKINCLAGNRTVINTYTAFNTKIPVNDRTP